MAHLRLNLEVINQMEGVKEVQHKTPKTMPKSHELGSKGPLANPEPEGLKSYGTLSIGI